MKKFLQLMASEASWGEPLKDYDGNVVRTTLPNGTQISLQQKAVHTKASGYDDSGNVYFTNNNDGSWLVKGTAKYNNIFKNLSSIASKNYEVEMGHKIYVQGISDNVWILALYVVSSGSESNPYTPHYDRILSAITGVGYNWFRIQTIYDTSVTINETIYPQILDLTEIFGEGNEPSTVDELNSLLWSEGQTKLGFIPRTDDVVAYTVHNGRLFKTE